MISVLQYLMGRIKVEGLTDEQVRNMNTLIPRVNDLLEKYGKSVVMTSGFRTVEDQERINPKVKHSKHMEAAAVDIGDSKGELYSWCMANLPILEHEGLWMEEGTKGWTHLQCKPPISGSRVFKP